MFPIVVNDGQSEFPTDDIFYIVCKEGVYLKKKLGVMESIAPVKNISILKSIQTMAKMHIKKIPAKTAQQIINFFKAVYLEHHAEAIVLLFYNQDTKKYKVVCPFQEVSAGAADYNKGVVIEGYDMIGTIHSHAGMSAFHSGVDDDDEKSFDGLHITFGNMNDPDISVSASIVANGFRTIVDPRDYINQLEMTIDIDEEVKVPYAKSWKWDKDQHKMVEIKSKNRFYTKRNFDQRFRVKLSKDPKFDISWTERVTKKVYQAPKWSQGWYGYGAHNQNSPHFDPDLWNGWGGHTTTGNSLVPLAVKGTPVGKGVPASGRVIRKSEISPCDACTFKNHKISINLDKLDDPSKKEVLAWALEQLENDADYTIRETLKGDDDSDFTHYHCEQCGGRFTVNELENDPICPTCGIDDHLEEITAMEVMLSDAEFASLEPIDEPTDKIGEGMNIIYCNSCGSSYSRDFLNGGNQCPVCNTVLNDGKTSGEDEIIAQSKADSGSYLDPEREAIEKALEADKELQRIPVPHQKAIPLNKPKKMGIIQSILNRTKKS